MIQLKIDGLAAQAVARSPHRLSFFDHSPLRLDLVCCDLDRGGELWKARQNSKRAAEQAPLAVLLFPQALMGWLSQFIA